ncbi:MAG: class I SAM-dependent methyltransferase [Gammaproteobacteria bacterium]|nr:class I SAM-dependent methyltransferase [Gammaproteobacteria bacterium]
MKSVRDHYDEFLGPVYSWILGDFETARRRNEAFFATLDLAPGPGAVAVDLGCGPGCQALPLAALGYDVLAIDFCSDLIDELVSRAGELPVRAVCDDLAVFRKYLEPDADLIVCMGDTLVHLPDEMTVFGVLDDVCEALKPGGRFIYAIRDYTSYVPAGADRFVPVRASDERIFTCFLDYRDDVVHVHDILHSKAGGAWEMTVSDYLKLRLDRAAVDARLMAGGLGIRARMLADGMIVGIADKLA